MSSAKAQVSADKSALRKELRRSMRLLTEPEWTAESRAILEKLRRLGELRRAGTVFCFLGVSPEPDTVRLIEWLLAEGKRVALPRCTGPGVMEARLITGLQGLVPGAYGIGEPDESAERIDPEEIEAAIIPGVAFDRAGGRLGHGAGYYDRYLRRTGALCCGICLDAALVERVPGEEHDVRMDLVITGTREMDLR